MVFLSLKNDFISKDSLTKVSISVLLISIILLTVFVGGFNLVVSNVIGLFILLFSLFIYAKKRASNISISVLLLLGLSLIYIVSSIINSPVVTSFIEAFLPLSLIGFAFLFAVFSSSEKNIISWLIMGFGLVTSIFAICIWSLHIENLGFVYEDRLMFPFQYANTSGVWYLVISILCWQTSNFKWRILSIFPLVALILTKSGGAICVFLLVSIIYIIKWFKFENHKRKWNVIAVIIIVLSVFVTAYLILNNTVRIQQASQTFIERIIQISDGFALLITSPLLGVGPDQWQFIYPYVQTAQYTASKIHCSYMQIALDGGIIALIVFILFVIYSIINLVKNRNWKMLICALVILIHSIIDFDLSYPLILILLLYFLDNKKLNINYIPNLIIIFICGLFCLVGIYINIQLNNIVKLPLKQAEAKEYNIGAVQPYLLNDAKASTYITIALNFSSRYDDSIFVSKLQEYPTTTQCVYCLDSLIKQTKIEEATKYLSNILELQPYNVALFKEAGVLIVNYNVEQLKTIYNNNAQKSNDLFELYPSRLLENSERIEMI